MSFGVVVCLFFYYHQYSVKGIMMFFSLLDPTRRQEARWLSGALALIRDGVGTSFGQKCRMLGILAFFNFVLVQ
jgi:hypothetical protein